MKTPSAARPLIPGAYCAFALAALYLFVILYAVAVPAEGRFESGGFFAGYARDPRLMNFLWADMAAVGLVSLALIPYVSALLRGANPEALRVAELFGASGAALSAASFLGMLGSAPGLAQTYLAGDAGVRAAIDAIGLPQLDPWRVLILGGPGIWFLLVNALAWRSGRFPWWLAATGIVLGVFLWAAAAAAVLRLDLLDQISAGVGGLCAPIWYLAAGVRLLGAAGSQARP